MDANALRPSVRDLFGQIPVSNRELRLWLWSVPVWFRYTSRPSAVAAYLRGYRVADKIARAKADGRLESIFGNECCPHCGQALESGTEERLDALEAENAELRAILQMPRASVTPLRPAPAVADDAEPCTRLPLAALRR